MGGVGGGGVCMFQGTPVMYSYDGHACTWPLHFYDSCFDALMP